MANIPIGNNIIYMKKKGSTEKKESVETILFGAERVDVGITSDVKEIATDSESGYRYERNRVDSQTIYNLRTLKRKCFFVLDLETGRGGKSWYPGCIRVADITGQNVEIKSEMSETSQTVFTVSNDTVQVLDLDYDVDKNIWYQIKYNDMTGYVRNTYVSNVRYVDPY